LIEKKRTRRRKPRLNQKRSSNHIRPFDNRANNVPRTKVALAKALEKYNGLAQDAISNGDRIVAEGYFQFAEHYQRVLNEIHENSVNSETIETNGSVKSYNDERPSRTQRAIDAKNIKNEKHNVSEDEYVQTKSESNVKKDGSKEAFTSDGIEALKPFEI
jgi:hypothetical protein